MATLGAASIQLFHELKIKYPEVPDEVVSSRMKENGNNREKCMKALQQDSSKYLYGRSSPPGRLTNDVHRQVEGLTISKPSQQSTVQHHVIKENRDAVTSVSWPPLGSECDPNNGLKPMASVGGQQVPHTAPVLPRDLNPFVNESSSAKQIPNINCHSGVENSGAGSPQSTGSPSEGRRAVKVLHMPSTSKSSGVGQTQPGSYMYKIQIEDGGGVCTVLPSQPSQISSPKWPRSISNEYLLERVPTPQSCVPVPHVSVSSNQQQTHSTQKTFFIGRNNSNTGQVSPDRTSTNTNQLTSYNSDQHLNVQQQGFVASGHTSPVPGYSGAPQSGPQGFHRPLFVELTSSGPEGAQTQLRYFPTAHDRSPNVNTFSGSPLLNSNRYGGSGVPSNPPSAHYQTGASFQLPPNQNVVAGHHIQSSQSAYVYPHYPSQVTSNISHHGVPVLGGHVESEQGNIVMQTSPEGMAFYSPGPISPASSHSSLSSESSNRDGTNQRPRSGSMQEETAYIQALLVHQRSRMEKLEQDFNNELHTVEKLRNEVSQMEENMGERSARRNSFPTTDDIARVRQVNRKVQTDIQVMINELDMYRNGQTPFSIIDPMGQQNFFLNMPTGQRNSIYSQLPPPSGSRNSESPPPVPPRLAHIPPAPPAQEPTGSTDSEDGEQWSCSACTLLNHPALNKCECCEMPRVTKGS
ncbi:TGF-beta-activated kinase 1 and MAP3K7-binding protein 3-like isoform X2 [Gigantopelta aegis]|uniref:TGF-beta-activated kinase 1 and MAP3K7-binding protein 3-like isoform X2 n=1 Tax=Gigantopelta aegis TaxID=1735272 RepID=UPI001B88D704|nr:TGF-beta-activated kinase 1 and MAP3K7-binding protein 3-like isoform X2 [Gigantopelta aegis]